MTEACHYYITTPANAFHEEAEIYIYLDATTTANMFVFSGNDRRNATFVIEGDVKANIGAPYRVPVGTGAIVTLQSSGGSARTGEGTFSYKVVG